MKMTVMGGIVAAAHLAGLGILLLSQGCGTSQPRVEPPPAPVMPPRAVQPLAPAPKPPPPAPFSPVPKPLPEEQLKTYEVRPGDSLGRIAQRYGITTRELIELNKIENPNRIRIGQKILLPAHVREREVATPAPPSPSPRTTPAGSIEHVVMPGESLSRIAQRYGVKVSEIMEANGLGSDRIRAGDRLVIPHPKNVPSGSAPVAHTKPSASAAAPAPAPTPAPAAPPNRSAEAPRKESPVEPAGPPTGGTAPLMYTVHEGDTLETIARTFMVRVDSLRRLNNLPPGAEVKAGQRIQIPSD